MWVDYRRTRASYVHCCHPKKVICWKIRHNKLCYTKLWWGRREVRGWEYNQPLYSSRKSLKSDSPLFMSAAITEKSQRWVWVWVVVKWWELCSSNGASERAKAQQDWVRGGGREKRNKSTAVLCVCEKTITPVRGLTCRSARAAARP